MEPNKRLTDLVKQREGRVFVFQRQLLISESFSPRALLSNKSKTANPMLTLAEAGLSSVKMNERNKREESVFYILL